MPGTKSYGQLFCDLAHAALESEERELARLNALNPHARPLGFGVTGEVPTGYLITKQALRDAGAPRIIGEVQYEGSPKFVDLCFVNEQDRAFASFELKLCDASHNGHWRGVCDDVTKHLVSPGTRIANAVESAERFNAIFLVTRTELSSGKAEGLIAERIQHLLPGPSLLASPSISLNPTENQYNVNWKHLRVGVLSAAEKTLASAS